MQSGFYPERLLGWISPSLFSSHGVHLLLPWALRLRWLHTTFQPWFCGVCVFLRMYCLYLVFCFSSLILTRKLDIPILCDSANDLLPQAWTPAGPPYSMLFPSLLLSPLASGFVTQMWLTYQIAAILCSRPMLPFGTALLRVPLSASRSLFLWRLFLP